MVHIWRPYEETRARCRFLQSSQQHTGVLGSGDQPPQAPFISPCITQIDTIWKCWLQQTTDCNSQQDSVRRKLEDFHVSSDLFQKQLGVCRPAPRRTGHWPAHMILSTSSCLWIAVTRLCVSWWQAKSNRLIKNYESSGRHAEICNKTESWA